MRKNNNFLIIFTNILSFFAIPFIANAKDTTGILKPIIAAQEAGFVPISEKHKLSKDINKILKTYKIKKQNEELSFLGKNLYFDNRLKKNFLSCNSCHNLSLSGTTPLANTNIPTTYSSIFNPINSDHFFSDYAYTIEVVNSINDYKKLFKKAYGNKAPINKENINKALIAYLATLFSPNRFDDFVRGNLKALNIDEIGGMYTFIKLKCNECHNGINLGEPTLRDISSTAPYLKESIFSLAKAIKHHQTTLKRQIADKEIKEILIFFATLNGRQTKSDYPLLPATDINTPINKSKL